MLKMVIIELEFTFFIFSAVEVFFYIFSINKVGFGNILSIMFVIIITKLSFES